MVKSILPTAYMFKGAEGGGVIGVPDLGPFSLRMRWIVARPYMAMASGSHCVVPSCERITSQSTKSCVGALYELTRMVAIGGQRRLMLCSAT